MQKLSSQKFPIVQYYLPMPLSAYAFTCLCLYLPTPMLLVVLHKELFQFK